MSIDLFKKILPQVAPLTEQVCLHLMGEPLLHPKFSQFIEACEEFQVPIFLVSNGVLLKEAHHELLLKSIFRQINFSLHSFFDNFPQKDPSLYLENIFKFTKQAFIERPELYINYRLWNLNSTKGASSDNHLILKHISDTFQIEIPTTTDVRKNKSFHIKNRLYLHYDTEFIWPSLDGPLLHTTGSCYGLRNHFGILADGTVVPCCLDKEGKIPLGHLESESLENILNSKKALQILKGFQNNQLIDPLCQKCQYIERFQSH